MIFRKKKGDLWRKKDSVFSFNKKSKKIDSFVNESIFLDVINDLQISHINIEL